jgi:hypothetical protein
MVGVPEDDSGLRPSAEARGRRAALHHTPVTVLRRGRPPAAVRLAVVAEDDAPRTRVFQERQGAQERPQRTSIVHRLEADGRRPATPRRVRLADEHVGDTGGVELRGEREELCLVGNREHDGVGASGHSGRARLTGGVCHLRSEEPEGEIGPHHDVVRERWGDRPGVIPRAS